MKRFLATALILCMALTLLPFGALAAGQTGSGYCGENLTWTLNSKGVLTISGTGRMDNYESSFDCPWWQLKDSVKSIVVGSGVTSIGDHAFGYCSSATSVSIANTVATIGKEAFRACDKLVTVDIPYGVTSIGEGAFGNSDGLKTVTISGSVQTIGSGAFEYCDYLTTVVLNEGLTTIGSSAFLDCKYIKSLTIPSTVRSIGYSAFEGCSGLTQIAIPYGVTTIEGGTFEKCYKLQSVSLPDTVSVIGSSAFEKCYHLVGIRIPNGVQTIPYDAFYDCSELEYVVLPASVTNIQSTAFWYCGDLKDVYYAGSEDQWNQITIGDFNEDLESATKHFFNSRGPLTFLDVNKGAYYYDAVAWAFAHEPQITNGLSETRFGPDVTCTRGQVVTFLWRANGCPEPTSYANPFGDVPSSAYYYKAVLWANERGITNGTTPWSFSPESPCTRAHVVTFLWRAEGQPAAGGSNPFTDVPGGQYYSNAVLWAVSQSITNGTTATTFSPNNPCTRGHIVTFLYRDMV